MTARLALLCRLLPVLVLSVLLAGRAVALEGLLQHFPEAPPGWHVTESYVDDYEGEIAISRGYAHPDGGEVWLEVIVGEEEVAMIQEEIREVLQANDPCCRSATIGGRPGVVGAFPDYGEAKAAVQIAGDVTVIADATDAPDAEALVVGLIERLDIDALLAGLGR